MLTEHTKSVVASTAQAAAQSTAVMQRSFMPEMQRISAGQLHKGWAHSSSGQPPSVNTKPKRAHESSATGGRPESSLGRVSPSPQLTPTNEHVNASDQTA